MIKKSLKIKMIKTGDIFPNPYQTRRHFERKELVALCESIKEVGLISPIIVRGSNNGYELICGQRRLRAAIMAGMKEVPSLVITAGDVQCAQLSIIENVQRKDLKPSEEAEGYYNMMAYHHIKKDKLLKIVSIDPQYLKEKVKILNLSEEVRYKIEENNIPEKITKELLRLHDENEQLEIIERTVKDKLSQNEVINLIDQSLKEFAARKKEMKENPKIKKFVKEKIPVYINTVEKTVELLRKNGAKTEILQTEQDEFIEFNLKIFK